MKALAVLVFLICGFGGLAIGIWLRATGHTGAGVALIFGGPAVGVVVAACIAVPSRRRENQEAAAKLAVEKALIAKRAELVLLRPALVRGCPKCGGNLGIEPDTPIEKVQQVVAGRCFYCGADLSTAAQSRES